MLTSEPVAPSGWETAQEGGGAPHSVPYPQFPIGTVPARGSASMLSDATIPPAPVLGWPMEHEVQLCRLWESKAYRVLTGHVERLKRDRANIRARPYGGGSLVQRG